MHLIEPEPTDGTEPIENYHAIRRELEAFDSELGSRPELVVVTKADLPNAEDMRRKLSEVAKGDVLLISAVTGQGLNELVGAIAALLHPPEAW